MEAYDSVVYSGSLFSNNVTINSFNVSEIECEIGSASWYNCSSLSYFDNLTKVRAKCGDLGDNATFNLTNLYDNSKFFIIQFSNDS